MIAYPPPDPRRTQRVLVIKLSALGDVVLSLRSFQAIRKHYSEAKITLLTTAPFQHICTATRCFDDIWEDTRPKVGHLRQIFRLRRKLLEAQFDLVIDLQGNDRTAMYYHLLLMNRPAWSGTVKGCRYYISRKESRRLHPTKREDAQLMQLGIEPRKEIDLQWLSRTENLRNYWMTGSDLLLVAGCAPQHFQKRWPLENFVKIAQKALDLGWNVHLIGTEQDAEINKTIKELCPKVRDLTGQTTLLELGKIGCKAGLALGNDTGPMHLLAMVSCPSVVLFGGESKAKLSAPIGTEVQTLQEDDIRRIDVTEVLRIMDLSSRLKKFQKITNKGKKVKKIKK